MGSQINRRIGMLPTPTVVSVAVCLAVPVRSVVPTVLFLMPRHSGNPPAVFAAGHLKFWPLSSIVTKDPTQAKGASQFDVKHRYTSEDECVRSPPTLLGYGVTVARLTLNQLVLVQI